MPRARILLVDDHRMVVDALKVLIETEFDVVEIFEDCQTLLKRAPELRPDVIVLDIGMPTMNGLSAGVQLRKLLPEVKLIYLTMNREPEMAAEAFRLGASGYVLKNSAAGELIAALREVLRGGYYASPVLTHGMVGSFVQAFKRMESRHNLTVRQREILQLLSEGMLMKQIASTLNISHRTVAYHKYKIMEQLNIKSNAELMAFALSILPQRD